jgi:CheY-like chemotaxis protein
MFASLQIMLIDDNRAWRETLSEYLRDKGFEVQTAEDGIPGLALLEKNGIQLAVIDLNMPGMNGLDLLRELKKRQSHVAVLVLSSEDDPNLPEQVVAEGAKAFLSKNTPPRLLMRKLLQFLTAALVEEVLERVLLGPADRLLPAPTLYNKANKPYRN